MREGKKVMGEWKEGMKERIRKEGGDGRKDCIKKGGRKGWS